jgi:DNA polymerase-1
MEIRVKSLMDDSTEEKKTRRKDAQERKKQATETMDDAWRRIFAMNNSELEVERLKVVKAAMDAGKISRDPADMVTKKGAAKKFSKAEAMLIFARLEKQRIAKYLEDMANSIPDNYTLVQKETQLSDMIRLLRQEPEFVFDVETTGTDTYNDVIVGVAITLPKADRHYYIPTNHQTSATQLDRGYVLEQLRPYFEDPNIGKIAHNGKFDIHMLANHGIGFAGLSWDTQPGMHVLNENEKSKRLKDIVTKYLEIPSLTYTDLFGSVGFDTVSDLRVALAYAAKDGDVTWKLAEFQRYHMKRTDLYDYFTTTEVPLVEVVVRMERAGFVIDFENAKRIGDGLKLEIDRLDAELRKSFGVGEDFNFGSPPQLTKLLYDELKLHKKLPKGMKKSTDEKALNVLQQHHPGIAKLLELRKASKLYGTYFDALPKKANAKGVVHGTFMQDGTVTGRFASKDPNLQNQPKYARQMFKAPPGMVLLTGDFSQQEPRILTHFSKEPLLVEAYLTGKDLYSAAASGLFGVPMEECGDGSVYRNMMKTGILAVMYGTTARTLGEQLGISTLEAQKFIDDFYAKYPYVAQFIRETEAYAKKHGYVRMMFGRKRRLPDAKSPDEWKVGRALRQAVNAMMQGSAAIQTKRTMIRLDAWAQERGYQIPLQVHDEVGAYVPDTIPAEHVREFEEIMTQTVTLDVPNKCDIEAQYVWGDGVSWDAQNERWVASHKISKKESHFIGAYATPKEALAALAEYRKGLES